ncbi:type II secretion system F family protein [Thiomicrorhabdus aquaedulcis]|uniref:type II secretion system F family protein n=1 Tax=Thiomicrorhabdus aquaedulcis TaxID=2211106 RepID=UPI000FD83155|nr:type II secretion system F family protein [Thiomicrorhabdus aquaedulcis]
MSGLDAGFLLVSLGILVPFALLAYARAHRKQQAQKAALSKLLLRAGISSAQQKTIKEQLMSQKDREWFIWLASKFKKAGLSDKNAMPTWFVAQAVTAFLSAFIVVSQFSVLNDKLVLLCIALPLLPSGFLLFKIHQRQTLLRKQFPDMLDSIVRSLQSGYGIDGALSAVAEDLKGPLAQEMGEVNKQLTIGISMRDILRDFQRRVALPEAQFFVITLIIQRETGGQLSQILSELARLMRRRVNFQAKLKTLTAESRFTAWFIGGAPVLYVAYKYFFDKPSLTFFLQDPTGVKLFSVSLVLILIGMLILRSMLKMRF